MNNNDSDIIIISRLSKSKSIVSAIVSIIICSVLFFALQRLIGGYRYVDMVRYGHPYNCPNITYQDAFNEFFDSPRWTFESSNDNKVVIFTGKTNVDGQYSTFEYRYKLDLSNNSFELIGLRIDGKEQSNLIALLWNNTPFSDYK